MDVDPGESTLLAHTQDKVVVVDEDGTFAYANEAAESILGYEPSELVGENAFEYVHPEDVGEVRAAFDRVVAADAPTTETVRYRHRAADGDYVWLESRVSSVTDPALGGYVVSSRDVTEQVTAERERQAAEDRLRELAVTVTDVLWMFDGDWETLLFINPAYEEVFGRSTEELAANPQSFLEAIHPEDVPAVKHAMGRLSDGESVDIEYRVNPAKDYGVWVWVQGIPVVEGGEVVRIVGFARDVTDRKRRERQLAVMDNLLRHNVRNAMNIVVGQAESLAAESDASAAHADVIRRHGEKLVETAEKQRRVIDLLTDAGCPVVLDSVDLVRDAVDVVREDYPDASITVDLPESAPVRALAEVGAAIVELVENAVRHAPDDAPAVRVSGRVEGDDVAVTIEDDCPPIPEPEFRVVTGEREMDEVYHSTGLGLWLVYWAVELSDGSVSFTQADERGNAVTLRLPRAEP